MVDFNRWLVEVLNDTRSEGIEWGPSYGENPWLALEEPQPQDEPLVEAFTADDVSTFRLLRTACEYYMARCESLQHTNADLTTQLDQLKVKLNEALVRAFETQQTLEREREVSMLQADRIVMGVQIGDHLSRQNSHGQRPTSLQQQITEAFQMLDVISGVPVEGTETESTSVSEWGPEGEGEGTQANELESAEHQTTVDTEERLHLSSREEGEAAQPSLAQSTATSDGYDYQHLTDLRASEDTSSSWYQHALRSLKDKREQRKPREDPEASSFTADADHKEAFSDDAQEFVQLVSIRNPAEDGEDSTWYRRALQHLKDERRRRASLRDRDSFTSTISIVD
ncbi:hypothetical protein F441_03420 [Phytophthora nicotianae CJ01A1]|uniref:Uncharacterized protein n=2 Tax=Phytophthora nicotianae TaxID=4792 RepID=W2JMU0_PHYNI|nr:hypothetical protein L915_03309 [Phytophthora nicotianae]ETL46943.1 hypothetical protein L916_03276 [Phytophthora nicotianae]ETP23480.1 hypothetical protein F441_03420 [Phytophthora nicotianae CJ01A1]